MNRLHQELRRLYLHPHAGSSDTAPQDGELLPDGAHTRALVLELARPADWRVLHAAWAGVQADLGLPAPAIAVNGNDGLQLWFSLAQPVLLAQAQAFLQALQQRYLSAVQPGRLALWPQAATATGGAPLHARLVPAEQSGNGQWSAFVAPDLAAVMNDEPWLDLPPNAEGQAALLAGLRSVPAGGLHMALQALLPAPLPVPVSGSVSSEGPTQPPTAATAHFTDPRAFLHSVMNDASAPLALRVEAAKALLTQQA